MYHSILCLHLLGFGGYNWNLGVVGCLDDVEFSTARFGTLHISVLPIQHMFYSSDYSVGKFYEDARQATRSILDSGRVPVVTGGTGLYLRWYVTISSCVNASFDLCFFICFFLF